MKARPRPRRSLDVWPGFVDALTSLLMVMVFVLLVFAIGQTVLSDTLSGKTRALDAVSARVRELAASLALSREQADRTTAAVGQLEKALDETRAERDRLQASLDDAAQRRARLSADVAALSELKRQMEAERGLLADDSAALRGALREQTVAQLAANDRIDRLSLQADLLREQSTRLKAALAVADQNKSARDLRIAGLRRELDTALLDQAGRLERYRSEFFGKLREALGNRRDVRVVGDRFLVPTDVLFPSGSAELEPDAETSLSLLVTTIREVSIHIPRTIDWVLRIDGHTDQVPIHTERFPSNWELSTARAVAIVKYLVDEGVPAERVSANGFGEFRPLDPGSGSEALARNRRIELQLTNR